MWLIGIKYLNRLKALLRICVKVMELLAIIINLNIFFLLISNFIRYFLTFALLAADVFNQYLSGYLIHLILHNAFISTCIVWECFSPGQTLHIVFLWPQAFQWQNNYFHHLWTSNHIGVPFETWCSVWLDYTLHADYQWTVIHSVQYYDSRVLV